jgi:endonuclease YncB( thermonuclease family)
MPPAVEQSRSPQVSSRHAARQFIENRVRFRRRIRRLRIGLLVALGLLLLWRAFRGAGDDYSRFDRRTFFVAAAMDGDTFLLTDRDHTPVTLLGVDAPDLPTGHFATEAAAYLRGRLEGKSVLLKLDGTETRDPAGRLRAYVYLSDTDLLNADIVRDGRAYADRRIKHTFGPIVEQLESEARKKQRGLWETVTLDDQPPWRQAWLRSREQT